MAINGSTLGLALSGGGFRATLFSMGSLWRLINQSTKYDLLR